MSGEGGRVGERGRRSGWIGIEIRLGSEGGMGPPSGELGEGISVERPIEDLGEFAGGAVDGCAGCQGGCGGEGGQGAVAVGNGSTNGDAEIGSEVEAVESETFPGEGFDEGGFGLEGRTAEAAVPPEGEGVALDEFEEGGFEGGGVSGTGGAAI